MRMSHIATLLAAGVTAAAIVAAPGAMAASTATDHNPLGVTITQRGGHIDIVATPPVVSPPRSYGSFPSAIPLLWD
jgi:hypothetical protein